MFELTKKKALILITLASTVFFINGIYVIYQFYIEGNVGRPVGFADGYMLLCGMNLLILPIIFTLSLSKKNIHKYLRWFFFLTIFINIPAIIFENTRIAWFELFFVLIISICYSIKEKIKKVFMIIFLIIYSLCCFQVSPSSVQRFETMSSTEYKIQSNYERILMWQSATNMFLDHPLIGVGIGNYHDEYINKYRSPLSREDQWHPHNVLLSMLSQTGIIGGLSYIILFTYLYYKSISDYKKTRNYITLAYISALTAFCINGLTDCNFVGHNLKEITYMFYFITGIYLILNKYVIINNENER